MDNLSVGGVLDRGPDQIFGTFKGALDKLKAMQAMPAGAFPQNKNARNAIWNRLIALDKPEMQAIVATMAEKAGHLPDERKMCDLCKFLAERMPASQDTPEEISASSG